MNLEEKNILGLKLPTDPRWANVVSMSLEDILTDHAYCEQKAATQCISIIQKFPDYPEVVSQLAPIVTEEWGHFRMVLAELKIRKLTLGKQRKDIYVNKLLEKKPKMLSRENQLLHKLLISALIEARSCERFRILSENLSEENLRVFYYKFMVSEAGHYRLFLDLAKLYFHENLLTETWQFWLDTEKEILKNLPLRGDRMH